jgi:hypothetical protein
MGTQSSIRRKTGRYRSTWSTTLKVDPVTFEGLLEIKVRVDIFLDSAYVHAVNGGVHAAESLTPDLPF